MLTVTVSHANLEFTAKSLKSKTIKKKTNDTIKETLINFVLAGV